MLYYTGAQQNQDEQEYGSRSLGGYISSSQIPNDELYNLFSQITKLDNQPSRYRLIAFKNPLGVVLNDLKIWVNNSDVEKIKLAAVSPVQGDNGPIFEKITKETNKPYQAIFQEYLTELTALSISSLATDEIIGIWIKQDIVNPTIVNEGEESQYCEDFNESDLIYQQQQDIFKIFLKWSD